MDLILIVKAAIMGIVEGLTEFLPVSSTGHLILAGSLMGFSEETVKSAKLFDIVIQAGAIIAVVIVYWQRVRDTLAGLGNDRRQQRFAINVLIGFLPAALLGVAFNSAIKAHLFTPAVVATTFILGGIIILWVERRAAPVVRIRSVDELAPVDALKVGLAQSLALVPGTSRSGATIIGGMLFGLSRQAATDFSFFLAIPTLIGASVYSLWKARHDLSGADLPLLVVGTLVSFVVAWIVVRWLLRYIATHTFVPFAWYRIAFGLVVLLTWWQGWVHWAD
ncbi:MAG: undecaprenyl-diphosphate phosphatase [Proteobacteria bacterium]|nr:undecaprenyl-diphosphate phosphatase [Pseudomonadota bacterium]